MTNGSERKKWVSDIIGNDYERWKNEFIILDCGTGCGKTYFCIRILGKYAQKNNKKILYLCNRSELKKQVWNDIGKAGLVGTDVITIKSYQQLQKEICGGQSYIGYDYIIADECHYFTTDATFNAYTDVSYNYVMKQKESVVLLISATAKSFFKNLVDRKKVKQRNYYRLDKDYSYVDKVYIYQKKELESIINDILENDTDSKIVVFCNSGDRIIEMHKIYRDRAEYFCSKTAKSSKLRSICGWDKDNKRNAVIKEYPDGTKTFTKQILFTTSVLDNGVDLKDKLIKHIFSEIIDVDMMIQALGRKRSLNKDDRCIFYIREYQKKGIQGLINSTEKQLELVKLYIENYETFYEKYGRGKDRLAIQRNNIFYFVFEEKNKKSGKIKINECRYQKYNQNYDMFTFMRDCGYVSYLEFYLPDELVNKSEYIVVNVEQIDKFEEFLKSIEGKRLYADDKKYIKEEFESIGVKLRYTGINTFNGALDDIYIDYPCRFYDRDENGKIYKDKRRTLENGLSNPNRDKCYWLLENRNKQ